MLVLPYSEQNTVNIIGIDPGSSTLGVAVLTINVQTMQIVSNEAWTVNAVKLSKNDSWLENNYGARFYRISLIGNTLMKVFQHFQPISIASESPFINSQFPATGIALTEVICMIRDTVLNFNPWRVLYLFPPSSVKNAVGAKGNAKKEDMLIAVSNINEIASTSINGVHTLDEHSIDALAVAYSQYLVYKNSTMSLI